MNRKEFLSIINEILPTKYIVSKIFKSNRHFYIFKLDLSSEIDVVNSICIDYKCIDSDNINKYKDFEYNSGYFLTSESDAEGSDFYICDSEEECIAKIENILLLE